MKFMYLDSCVAFDSHAAQLLLDVLRVGVLAREQIALSDQEKEFLGRFEAYLRFAAERA